MNAGKLLNVFDKGVAMLVAAREAREYEDCGTGVSAESFKRGGHLMTISLNDLTVKELHANVRSFSSFRNSVSTAAAVSR